jgi:ribosomal protein L7/L12
MNADLPEDKITEIKTAIFAGRKIEAIKLFRHYGGTGLKEAKDFIENFTRELKAKEPDKFVSLRMAKGCAGVVVLIGLVVSVVVFWITHSGA